VKTWLVTGVSSGFGRALAEAALSRGDRVVGTLRQEAQRAEFDALAPGRAVGVILDVRQDADVRRVVGEIETTVEPIDVLVNNAGYGYEGSIEEASMADIRAQFDVNVFGAISVIQAVLPFMRQRRAGRILNVTSMGGLMTFPGVGIYHGSKFALEGISETLAKEVAEFGIKVTAIEPGSFRTDWAGRSMQRGARTIADYDASFEPIRKARAARSGNQPGDPLKAAQAILQVADAPNPPVHLLLGSDALSLVREKLDGLNQEIDAWEHVTVGTDFSRDEHGAFGRRILPLRVSRRVRAERCAPMRIGVSWEWQVSRVAAARPDGATAAGACSNDSHRLAADNFEPFDQFAARGQFHVLVVLDLETQGVDFALDTVQPGLPIVFRHGGELVDGCVDPAVQVADTCVIHKNLRCVKGSTMAQRWLNDRRRPFQASRPVYRSICS
jgi:NAD(P)-dependent dehydrogenase (short-subunit alcohol dehydrogenase family)